MDFSMVAESFLKSVRSAGAFRILSSLPSNRPEVPARAAAAAVVARALAKLPPHQKNIFSTNSEYLISIYNSSPHEQSTTEELEENFYEKDFDPVRYVLEHIPPKGNDLSYFEEKAELRITQLDKIAEKLSCHVMEHHEEMVEGMQLVMELEQDLKVANVICMNGRRHLTSSKHEVSRDLVVNSYTKMKQDLLNVLHILNKLRHALDMQMELEVLVEEGNYVGAFQVLSEYLQVVDSFPELAAMQEMSQGVEEWLACTLHKLDALLLGVCQSFKQDNYLTAVDAYAIIGDIAGFAEKIQSFFLQEALSGTHSVLKEIVQENIWKGLQKNRFTYSDLCDKIPESKFRQCLLTTLDILFKLMCSYYAIMSFHTEYSNSECLSSYIERASKNMSECSEGVPASSGTQTSHVAEDSSTMSTLFIDKNSEDAVASIQNTCRSVHNESNNVSVCHHSPFHQLRKDAAEFVAQTLDRGRKNLWNLMTTRISVLLSCSAVYSSSTNQFLRNYEDLNVFIAAGEAFCGVEAVEVRQHLKKVCEKYVSNFHHQNIHALKLSLDKENWVKISSDALPVINLAGLVGDGAPLMVSFSSNSTGSLIQSTQRNDITEAESPKNGFAYWLRIENPFMSRLSCSLRGPPSYMNIPNGSLHSGLPDCNAGDILKTGHVSTSGSFDNQLTRSDSGLDDENEDLLADFIDEDSQLPSRMPKTLHARTTTTTTTTTTNGCNDAEISAQTGSSLCLLRLMDKYARFMQKLEIVNVEFFKGIYQLFGLFFHFIFEAFDQRETNSLTCRLKSALTRASQVYDPWISQQALPCSPTSLTVSPGTSFTQTEASPTSPTNSFFGYAPNTTFGLKERCVGAETISLVARVLHRSRSHLQSMLLQNNVALVDDFFEIMVDSVPDLVEYIHSTTVTLLLHVNGYAEKVINVNWEVKDLGLEHNSYVDLFLEEFKHYKTRLANGEISKEVQNLLLVYGLENVAEILLEGLSHVKRCTDEGRALMSLDLQVLINGLQHFIPIDVKPKMQVIETFIKAYYLPESEYVYWAHSHPEYSKGQIIGLVNLVSTMKSWKRKTRLEVLEKIDTGT